MLFLLYHGGPKRSTFFWFPLISDFKFDTPVKSLQTCHSRERGSLEVIDFPGFPRSRECRQRVLSDFLRIHQVSSLERLLFVNIQTTIRRLCRHRPPTLDISCLIPILIGCSAPLHTFRILFYFHVLALNVRLWHASCCIKATR